MEHSLNLETLTDKYELDSYLKDLGVPDRSPVEPNATKNQHQLIWELGYENVEQIKALGKKQAIYLIDVLKAIKQHETEQAMVQSVISKRKSKTKTLWVVTAVSFLIFQISKLFENDWAVITGGFALLFFVITLFWGIASLYKYGKLRWRYRGKRNMAIVTSSVKSRF